MGNHDLIDIRCAECGRLLARAVVGSRVEIKCPRCKRMNLFDGSAGGTKDKLARPDKVKMATP